MKNRPFATLFLIFSGILSVNADPLAIGGNIAGPSNSAFFGGTILASASSTLSTSPFGGTAVTSVYRTAGNTLDFYYQFSLTGSFEITRFEMGNFSGATTDVYNITNGAAIGASFVAGTIDTSSANRGANVANNSIGFNFSAGSFLGGTASLPIVIRTNVTDFTSTGVFGVALDGPTGGSGSITISSIFAPVITAPQAGVPEGGTTVGLFTLTLAGLAAFRRKLID